MSLFKFCGNCKHFSFGTPTYDNPIPDTGCVLLDDFRDGSDDPCDNFEPREKKGGE